MRGDNFRQIFAKFSQVFRSFCKFFEDFGLALTCPDLFGCVRMRSDLSGWIRMHLDAFGKIGKNSENLKNSENYLDVAGLVFNRILLNNIFLRAI